MRDLFVVPAVESVLEAANRMGVTNGQWTVDLGSMTAMNARGVWDTSFALCLRFNGKPAGLVHVYVYTFRGKPVSYHMTFFTPFRQWTIVSSFPDFDKCCASVMAHMTEWAIQSV